MSSEIKETHPTKNLPEDTDGGEKRQPTRPIHALLVRRPAALQSAAPLICTLLMTSSHLKAIVLPAMLAYVIFPEYTYKPDTTSCQFPVDGRISLQSCHMQSKTFGSTLTASQECRTWEMPANASVLGFTTEKNGTCGGCIVDTVDGIVGSDGVSAAGGDYYGGSGDGSGGRMAMEAFKNAMTGGKNWTEIGWEKNFCECVTDCSAVNEMDNSRRAFFMVGAAMAAWFAISMLNAVAKTKERSQMKGAALPPPAPMMPVATLSLSRLLSFLLLLSSPGSNRNVLSRPVKHIPCRGSMTYADLRALITSSFSFSRPAMLNTFNNRVFTLLLPAWVLDSMFLSIFMSLLPFYIRYVIAPEYASEECSCNGKPLADAPMLCSSKTVMFLAMVAVMVMAGIAVPFWKLLAEKYGKRRTWLFWSLSTAITNVLFIFIGKGDVVATIVIAGINGATMSAKFLADAILADVIDYDEFLTGSRSEATYTMFRTFLPKIAAIPASALPVAFLAFFGHIPPIDGVYQEQTDPRLVPYLKIMFIGVPCVFAFGAFYFKLKFPLKTKEQTDKISEGIAKHMLRLPSTCPVSGTPYWVYQMSDEDRKLSYLVDNFMGVNVLQGMIDAPQKTVARLKNKVVKQFAFSVVCVAGSAIMLQQTFKYLGDGSADAENDDAVAGVAVTNASLGGMGGIGMGGVGGEMLCNIGFNSTRTLVGILGASAPGAAAAATAAAAGVGMGVGVWGEGGPAGQDLGANAEGDMGAEAGAEVGGGKRGGGNGIGIGAGMGAGAGAGGVSDELVVGVGEVFGLNITLPSPDEPVKARTSLRNHRARSRTLDGALCQHPRPPLETVKPRLVSY